MKKAYHRVEWDFLEACLLKMRHCSQSVDRVMKCVKTASLSVKFNGEPLPYFLPTRELRQGDRISPYLFILMTNTLSMLMKKAVNEGLSKASNLIGIALHFHIYYLLTTLSFWMGNWWNVKIWL